MISKQNLLSMICDLTAEMDTINNELEDIRKEIKKLKKAKKTTDTTVVKRKPGRPRKQK